MRWSDDFYVATGGGCRRVPLDVDGKIIDAASVDLHTMQKCCAEGEYPHPPKGKLVGTERLAKRRTWTEADAEPKLSEYADAMILDYARLRAR